MPNSQRLTKVQHSQFGEKEKGSFQSKIAAGRFSQPVQQAPKEAKMDDDDKFWKIPEGRSWKEAGPILRSLTAKPAKPVKRSRRAKATPSKPWTPQQRAEQYQRTADFYRRIGQDFEADHWDRQAAKARQVAQGAAHG